ncbi:MULTISPECIES: GNAT family N-acetyltransferase [unclassified Thiocapsa]|uniref:GNAT family N-acetyltransferase n=1 Tax=unclassified Thiocapsa TaxID=2641286 RepID=UPI0035AE62A4
MRDAGASSVRVVIGQTADVHPLHELLIDIMIGERGDAGKGVGAAAIRLVAEVALSDPAVPFVIAAVLADNLASQRAFAKAGFRNDREFDDVPSGRCVLMSRPRQDGEVAHERP